MKNTLQRGSIRTIIFKEGGTWYGTALEFNIVVEGDTSDMAMFNVQEAIVGYLNSLKKIGGLRDFDMLNQRAEDEYEALWKALGSNEPAPSPYQVSFYGRQMITA